LTSFFCSITHSLTHSLSIAHPKKMDSIFWTLFRETFLEHPENTDDWQPMAALMDTQMLLQQCVLFYEIDPLLSYSPFPWAVLNEIMKSRGALLGRRACNHDILADLDRFITLVCTAALLENVSESESS
jgi:hypothetical protein